MYRSYSGQQEILYRPIYIYIPSGSICLQGSTRICCTCIYLPMHSSFHLYQTNFVSDENKAAPHMPVTNLHTAIYMHCITAANTRIYSHTPGAVLYKYLHFAWGPWETRGLRRGARSLGKLCRSRVRLYAVFDTEPRYNH